MAGDRVDRTAIAPLLLPHFPEMRGKSSAEWHVFLNRQTGLSVEPDEPNSTAFDAWRKALAVSGLPVWGMSNARLSAVTERASIMQAAEAKRKMQEAELLSRLKQEAPLVLAKDLLK